jgi:predicted nucleic acid-binding protein
MAGFLLDTNHLGEALRPVSQVRDRIGALHLAGIRIGTCVPVLCELHAGITAGDRGEKYRLALERLLGRVRLWPLDSEAARLYGQVFQESRKRGRVLSQVDMILVALAMQRNLTLATTDRDFEVFSNLKTENWL